MADYPTVFPENPILPVAPGGTQVRLPRRRARREEENPPPDSEGPEWRDLLERAVSELNEEFSRHGAPYVCQLHEDGEGFLLRVVRRDTLTERPGAAEAPPPEVTEELLEAADLPVWLGRLRAGLGILVDKNV